MAVDPAVDGIMPLSVRVNSASNSPAAFETSNTGFTDATQSFKFLDPQFKSGNAQVVALVTVATGGEEITVELFDATAAVSRGSASLTPAASLTWEALVFNVSGVVPGNSHNLRIKSTGGGGVRLAGSSFLRALG